MQIDERFLTVHPATAAWWERRSSCESCKHLKLREGHEGEGVMRCTAVRVDQRASRDLLGAYCIDVRDEAGPCGPPALMWEGRNEGATHPKAQAATGQGRRAPRVRR